MIVEGVRYHRFVIRFRLSDGRRRRWIRWAPAACYAAESIRRELDDMFGPNELGDPCRVVISR